MCDRDIGEAEAGESEEDGGKDSDNEGEGERENEGDVGEENDCDRPGVEDDERDVVDGLLEVLDDCKPVVGGAGPSTLGNFINLKRLFLLSCPLTLRCI